MSISHSSIDYKVRTPVTHERPLQDTLQKVFGTVALRLHDTTPDTQRYLEASDAFREISQNPEASPRDVRRHAKEVLRITKSYPDFLELGEYETFHRDPRLRDTRIPKQADKIAQQHENYDVWMKGKNVVVHDPIIED